MEPAEEAGTYFYFRRWSYKYFNEGDAARVFEASLSNSLKKLYWFVMTAGLSGSLHSRISRRRMRMRQQSKHIIKNNLKTESADKIFTFTSSSSCVFFFFVASALPARWRLLCAAALHDSQFIIILLYLTPGVQLLGLSCLKQAALAPPPLNQLSETAGGRGFWDYYKRIPHVYDIVRIQEYKKLCETARLVRGAAHNFIDSLIRC